MKQSKYIYGGNISIPSNITSDIVLNGSVTNKKGNDDVYGKQI